MHLLLMAVAISDVTLFEICNNKRFILSFICGFVMMVMCDELNMLFVNAICIHTVHEINTQYLFISV